MSEEDTVNPYAPPQAPVADGPIGEGVLAFRRFSAWSVFGLTLITLGIYGVYWLYSRTRSLNQMLPAAPIGEGFINATLVLYAINFVVAVAAGFNADDAQINMFSNVVGVLSAILVIAWAFMFRDALSKITQRPKGNGVLTFFLSSIYLQYKINQSIDAIRGVPA